MKEGKPCPMSFNHFVRELSETNHDDPSAAIPMALWGFKW